MINILLIDDNIHIIKCIQNIIRDYSDMQVIGKASGGDDALEILTENQADIILLVMSVQNFIGFCTIESLRANGIILPILMLNINNQKEYCLKATNSKIEDKANARVELILAIRQVIREKNNLEHCEVLVSL